MHLSYRKHTPFILSLSFCLMSSLPGLLYAGGDKDGAGEERPSKAASSTMQNLLPPRGGVMVVEEDPSTPPPPYTQQRAPAPVTMNRNEASTAGDQASDEIEKLRAVVEKLRRDKEKQELEAERKQLEDDIARSASSKNTGASSSAQPSSPEDDETDPSLEFGEYWRRQKEKHGGELPLHLKAEKELQRLTGKLRGVLGVDKKGDD